MTELQNFVRNLIKSEYLSTQSHRYLFSHFKNINYGEEGEVNRMLQTVNVVSQGVPYQYRLGTLNNLHNLTFMKMFTGQDDRWTSDPPTQEEIDQMVLSYEPVTLSWLTWKVEHTKDLSTIDPDDFYCDE